MEFNARDLIGQIMGIKNAQDATQVRARLNSLKGKVTDTQYNQLTNALESKTKNMPSNPIGRQSNVDLNSLQWGTPNIVQQANELKRSAALEQLALDKQVAMDNLIAKTTDHGRSITPNKPNNSRYKPLNPAVAPYSTLTKDTSISWEVNEFLTRYFTQKSGLSADTQWKAFVRGSSMPKGMQYNSNLEQQVLQEVKALEDRLGGSNQAKQHFSGMSYQSTVREIEGVKVALNTAFSNDKKTALLFALDKGNEDTLSKSLAQMFSLYKGLEKIEVATKSGVKTFTRDSNIISGPTTDNLLQGKAKLAQNANRLKKDHIGTTNYYKPTQAAKTTYENTQAELQAIALKQLEDLSKTAVATMPVGVLEKFLAHTKVKDLKKYGSYFGDQFSKLAQYSLSDNNTLSQTLSPEQVKNIRLATARNRAEEYAVHARAAQKQTVNLGSELGVSKKAIITEASKNLGRDTTKHLEALHAINSFFTESKHDAIAYARQTGSKETNPQALFDKKYPERIGFLDLMKSSRPEVYKSAVSMLMANKNNRTWLESRGLLAENTANPILNLKGLVQEKFTRVLARSISDNPNSIDGRMDPELLNLLSSKALGHANKIFESERNVASPVGALAVKKFEGRLIDNLNDMVEGQKFAKVYNSAGFTQVVNKTLMGDIDLGDTVANRAEQQEKLQQESSRIFSDMIKNHEGKVKVQALEQMKQQAHEQAMFNLGLDSDGMQIETLSLKEKFFGAQSQVNIGKLLKAKNLDKVNSSKLSEFDQLQIKMAKGTMTIEDHKNLMDTAAALGIGNSSNFGSIGGLQKIIKGLREGQYEFNALTVEGKADLSSPRIHISKELRKSILEGFSSDPKINKQQLAEYNKLGLYNEVDGRLEVSKIMKTASESTLMMVKGSPEDKKTRQYLTEYFAGLDVDQLTVGEKKRAVAIHTALASGAAVTQKMVDIRKNAQVKADPHNMIENMYNTLSLDPKNAQYTTLKASQHSILRKKSELTDQALQNMLKYDSVKQFYNNPEVAGKVDGFYASVPVDGAETNKLISRLGEFGTLETSKLRDFRGMKLNDKLNLVGKALHIKYLDSLGTDANGNKVHTARSIAYSSAMNKLSGDIASLTSGQVGRTAKLDIVSKLRGTPVASLVSQKYLENEMANTIAFAHLNTGGDRKFQLGDIVDDLSKARLKAEALTNIERDFGIHREGLGAVQYPFKALAGQGTTELRASRLSMLDSLSNASPLGGQFYDSIDLDPGALGYVAKSTREVAINNHKRNLATSALMKGRQVELPSEEPRLRPFIRAAREGKVKFSATDLLELAKHVPFLRLATGGKIPGKGHVDEVPALLMKGEMVVDRATTESLGIHTNSDYKRFKQAIANGKVKHFAEGGMTDEEKQKIQDALLSQGISLESAAKILESSVGKAPGARLGESVLSLGDEPEYNHTPAAVAVDNGVKPKAPSALKAINTDTIAKKTESANAFRELTNQLKRGTILDAATMLSPKNLLELEQAHGSGFVSKLKPYQELVANSGSLSKVDSIESILSVNNSSSLGADQAAILKKISSSKAQTLNIKERTDSANADFVSNMNNTAMNELAEMWKDPRKAKNMMSRVLEAETTATNPKTVKNVSDMKVKMTELMLGSSYGEVTDALRKGDTSTLSPLGRAALDGLSSNSQQLQDFKKVATPDIAEGVHKYSGAKDDGLTNAMKLVNNNLTEVSKILRTEAKPITNRAEFNQFIGEVLKNNADGGFTAANVDGGAKGAAKAKDMFNTLKGGIDKNQDFDSYHSMGEMGRQAESVQRIKESSQMRWANFKDLMVQNTAFAASYAVLGGATSSIVGATQFIVNLDEKMKNLQAITGSTTPEVAKMASTIKEVSTQTKFSAGEIADAATVLGQAGFSAQDISESLGGVVKLATATGSSLDEATQTLTSALTIWDAPMKASESYANEFTAAINKSKLDINSLGMALQYSGSIAAEGGIPVEDLVTVTSLMKDAGVKSASTSGTGQRLVYSDILAPSSKFTKSLAQVGITKKQMGEKFDEEGVLGVLKLMRDEGYGFGQATSGMEVREKSAYLTVAGQLDRASNFRSSIMGTNAAGDANKVQMSSLANQTKNMFNSWGIALDTMAGDKLSSVGRFFEAITYSPNKTNNLQVGAGVDYYKETQDGINGGNSGVGGAIIGGLAIGGAGYALHKFAKNNPGGGLGKIGSKLYSPPIEGGGFKTASGGFFGGAVDKFKGLSVGAKAGGALGILETGYNLVQASQSKTPVRTFIQDMMPTLIGIATAAIAAPLLGLGAVAAGGVGIGASLLGGSALKGSTDKAVDKVGNFFGTDWGKPTGNEILQDAGARLAGSKSTLSDLYKYENAVGKAKNNPLRDGKDATEADKAITRSNITKQGLQFNESFKAEIDQLEKATGQVTDFSNAGSADELQSQLKSFRKSFKENIVVKSFKPMMEALEKTSATPIEDLTGKTVGDATKAAESKIGSTLANLATVAPELLLAQGKELDKVTRKYFAGALKQDTKLLQDKLAGEVSSGEITKTESGAKYIKEKAKLTNENTKREKAVLDSRRSEALTGYVNLNSSDEVMKYVADLKGNTAKGAIRTKAEVADNKFTQAEFASIEKGSATQYQRHREEETGIDKIKAQVVELVNQTDEINQAFKSFYKDTISQVGQQAVDLGRKFGNTMLKEASNLGNSNWGDTAGLQHTLGSMAVNGLNEKYMKTSPTDLESKSVISLLNKNIKFNTLGALQAGGNQAGAKEFNAMLAAEPIAAAIADMPSTLEGLINKHGQDPFMLKQFNARKDALENNGINRNVDIDALKGLSFENILAMSTKQKESIVDPLAKKKMETSKNFEIYQLDAKYASIKEMQIGGKNISENQSEKGYALKENHRQYELGIAAFNRSQEFQKTQLMTNYSRNIRDFSARIDFQRQEMGIGFAQSQAAAQRQYDFQQTMIRMQAGWAKADALKGSGDSKDDAGKKRDYAIQDLNLNTKYKTEDVNKDFSRTVAQLNTSLTRQIDGIDRAMQFSRDMFNRSMDKPVNLTLNPAAFLKVADNLNDNTLALDAHKAELGANTTAIQQLVGLQQTKESLVKDAYKYAYKSVGGAVTNEDGTTSAKFTEMYDKYMQNNSGQLLDTVLNQAMNKTFAGAGFDATKALTDSNYIAQSVANPGESTTPAGIMQGSGYSVEDFVNALFKDGSGEIHVTTSQGVVLEAQGNLAGALFDLETQMVSYQNQISEVGIAFSQNMEDARLSLKYSLDDIATAYQRGLDAINTAYARDIEQISDSLQRAMEAISTNLDRQAESAALQHQFQMQEAAIQFQQALEALSRQEAFNKAQMEQGLKDALTDLASTAEFKLGESAINNDQNIISINDQFGRLIEKLDLQKEENIRALEQQYNDTLSKVIIDAQIMLEMFNRSLKAALTEQLPDLAYAVKSIEGGINKAATEMDWKFAGAIKAISEGWDKAFKDDATSKAIRELGGATLRSIVDSMGKDQDTTIKDVWAKYDEPIKNAFKASYDSLATNVQTAATESGKKIVEAAAVVQQNSVALDQALTKLTTFGEARSSDLTNMTTTLASLASTTINAMSTMATQIAAARDSIARAASAGTGYNTGGAIPGYGGGDSVPAMLEPGEYVLRKEAVRSLGIDYVAGLNNSIVGAKLGDGLSSISIKNVTSLPTQATEAKSGDSNISVGISVHPEMTIRSIQDNIEKIADGVHKVFQEYM
jgi:TP901 family phage tail tape measure protein